MASSHNSKPEEGADHVTLHTTAAPPCQGEACNNHISILYLARDTTLLVRRKYRLRMTTWLALVERNKSHFKPEL